MSKERAWGEGLLAVLTLASAFAGFLFFNLKKPKFGPASAGDYFFIALGPFYIFVGSLLLRLNLYLINVILEGQEFPRETTAFIYAICVIFWPLTILILAFISVIVSVMRLTLPD